MEPISPIPLTVDYDKKKALLGKELFSDTLLSKDNSVSCLSCHNIYNGGADEREVSMGFNGELGNIQSPTVLNARYNFKQFWNGRAANLYEQAGGPLHNPVEHNMDEKIIEERLNASSEYKAKFLEVFGVSKITYPLVLEAIVEFENALITPNAKFDKYLRGEIELSLDEKEGYRLFKQYGCITCHNGINIGGNSFQQMGTFIEYKSSKDYPDRSLITHKKEHKNVFKVPSLRNIALSAPYFHDASSKTLKDAVLNMSHYNLGIKLPEHEVEHIVLFLKTLTGERPPILDDK
jgi:cytochrome c peroxidase